LLVGNYGTGKSHLIIGIFRKQEESQAFRPGIVVRLSEKGEAKKKAREPKGK
jgi:DNA replication protein DnaC